MEFLKTVEKGRNLESEPMEKEDWIEPEPMSPPPPPYEEEEEYRGAPGARCLRLLRLCGCGDKEDRDGDRGGRDRVESPYDEGSCLARLDALERQFNEAKEEIEKRKQERDDALETIQDKLDEYMVSLVDNKEFLDWAGNHVHENWDCQFSDGKFTPFLEAEACDLKEDEWYMRPESLDEIKGFFMTDEAGKTPDLDSQEDLDKALRDLFYFRAYQGLDMMAVAGMMMPPNFDMCDWGVQMESSEMWSVVE